ncbi:Uncharacterised protein [Staphylococcus aureus]|nr:Uncharacterised protein [Staphylococcus aureus]
MGLSKIGSISFGIALVAGKNLVPKPAAGMIAFFIFFKVNVLLFLSIKSMYQRHFNTN